MLLCFLLFKFDTVLLVQYKIMTYFVASLVISYYMDNNNNILRIRN